MSKWNLWGLFLSSVRIQNSAGVGRKRGRWSMGMGLIAVCSSVAAWLCNNSSCNQENRARCSATPVSLHYLDSVIQLQTSTHTLFFVYVATLILRSGAAAGVVFSCRDQDCQQWCQLSAGKLEQRRLTLPTSTSHICELWPGHWAGRV